MDCSLNYKSLLPENLVEDVVSVYRHVSSKDLVSIFCFVTNSNGNVYRFLKERDSCNFIYYFTISSPNACLTRIFF